MEIALVDPSDYPQARILDAEGNFELDVLVNPLDVINVSETFYAAMDRLGLTKLWSIAPRTTGSKAFFITEKRVLYEKMAITSCLTSGPFLNSFRKGYNSYYGMYGLVLDHEPTMAELKELTTGVVPKFVGCCSEATSVTKNKWPLCTIRAPEDIPVPGKTWLVTVPMRRDSNKKQKVEAL